MVKPVAKYSYPVQCLYKFLLPVVFSLPVPGVLARDLPYGAIEEPQLVKCDRSYWQGKQEEAKLCYSTLLHNSPDITTRAEAAWALGDVKTANEHFRNAVRMNPGDASVRARWGELFVETYQYQEALNLFNEALAADPDSVLANVGAASVLAKNFDAQALDYLEKAISNDDIQAGMRLRAMLLLAHMALEESSLDNAEEILEDAGELAKEESLPELEVFALRASLDLLRGATHSEWIDRALEINPSYADIYAIPAYFYWITRLYKLAGEFYQKALDLQYDHWEAHLELGINYLRFNQVADARRHLEISYEGDPYNPKTVNTLRLLDTFEKFELISYPEQPQDGLLPTMLLRLHKNETGIIMPYTVRLAESAMQRFTERYGFKPREPVIIEIYPNHEDFIVRTIGMPGMGLLGVTFGYLVAMDSPSGKAGNDYHWGTTLWHELAHVYTLKMTDNRVPRWYSEGISVFEEWRTGPLKGIRIPVDVYRAMAEDKFLPVAELDRGFIRPTYPNQVIVSYMQSGLVCEFIDTTFGFDKLVSLLDQFKDGIDTAAAIENVLQISPSSFDRQFNKYIKEKFGQLLDNLDEWEKYRMVSVQAVHEEDWETAMKNSEKAIELFPEYVEPDSPYLTLATAYAKTDKPYNQIEVLESYWRKGGYVPGPLKTLAEYLYQQNRVNDAVDVLMALNYVIPFDNELHNQLGDWLMELDRPQQALQEYQVSLAMEPHDMAAAHFRTARAHFALDQTEDTRNHLLSALEIAPHYRPAQKLLVEIARGNNGKMINETGEIEQP